MQRLYLYFGTQGDVWNTRGKIDVLFPAVFTSKYLYHDKSHFA